MPTLKVLAALLTLAPQPARASDDALSRAGAIIESLVADSFPELRSRRIRLAVLDAKADYFRTAFAVRRFALFMPMQYVVWVNPNVWTRGAPEEGIRAILAHELAHVVQLSRGPRIRRVGLVRLIFDGPETRFERAADLDAIARGHGAGLRAYREWLYRNVPAEAVAEKRRHYFDPEEIDAIVRRIRERPALIDHWRRHVPMNLRQIEETP